MFMDSNTNKGCLKQHMSKRAVKLKYLPDMLTIVLSGPISQNGWGIQTKVHNFGFNSAIKSKIEE